MKASRPMLFAAAVTMLGAFARAEDAAVPSAAPAAAAEAPEASASVSVKELSVGTGVQDRVLQGAADSFPASAGRVTCFSRVSAKSVPATVRHVWKKDGETRGEINLNVGGDGWRTWSNHAVEPGSWTVEVQDADGVKAASISFTVNP